jgi:hypothetical protein
MQRRDPSQIAVQPLFFRFPVGWNVEEPERLQSPYQYIQTLEHMEPEQQRSKNRFLVHALTAKNETPELSGRTADQFPITPFIDDSNQLVKVGDPLDHEGSGGK